MRRRRTKWCSAWPSGRSAAPQEWVDSEQLHQCGNCDDSGEHEGDDPFEKIDLGARHLAADLLDLLEQAQLDLARGGAHVQDIGTDLLDSCLSSARRCSMSSLSAARTGSISACRRKSLSWTWPWVTNSSRSGYRSPWRSKPLAMTRAGALVRCAGQGLVECDT